MTTTPASPGPNARFIPRPLILNGDDSSLLGTRSGTLATLLRNRSQQHVGSWPPNQHHHNGSRDAPGDEEAALPLLRGAPKPPASEEIERLLMNESRMSQILNGPQARSMSLIGKSNPRYRWERYWKGEEELKTMTKPLRKYYERTNELIEQYLYIDCLLDSAIPHELLNEYSAELDASAFKPQDAPETIDEEPTRTPERSSTISYGTVSSPNTSSATSTTAVGSAQIRRTPKDIFRATEDMPLLQPDNTGAPLSASSATLTGPTPNLPWLEDAEIDSDDPIVSLAIWINMIANIILLAGKLIVVFSVPSMSVLASLVDAVLDFLSTAIVYITTRLISSSQKDQYNYPVGRRRLEPLGVLVFSVIMITSFTQVALESTQRLAGPNHEILELGVPALAIMLGTIIIKGGCWIWCRLVKNSSVRALADDAMTDVIFNAGSIFFPIVGFYARIWWMDALGGLLLSLVVIINWSQTSAHHVRNLTGFSAHPDERNLLLYLTMRFATAIRKIQNLRAYHAGDKLFVEVDIVLSANTPLKDSHDLSEVLTYFLESVPIVDRAFVHVDYATYNAPTHILKSAAA
ncbi:cation diffusion facilitator 10 [Stachybotrys elegans]|uniref:Cation diffusion facilitator 10 n=1 Tax=Stachybotrys elegans TaxID=80388 RepID=A0A8K0T293_9HYPO|nr:cation diffusion facilitator 10 [Stachybotrys elegans]